MVDRSCPFVYLAEAGIMGEYDKLVTADPEDFFVLQRFSSSRRAILAIR